VIERDRKHREWTGAVWLCRCSCGVARLVKSGSLRSGRSKSCGCLSRELVAVRTTNRNTKHGLARAGKHHPLFGLWKRMRQRCLDENCDDYPDYGGRGVTVCERWHADFAAFLEDVGPRPSRGHSLDRIDNDRGYEPGNVRWATPVVQARNRPRINVLDDRLVSEIRALRTTGLSPKRIAHRLSLPCSAVAKVVYGMTWKD